MDSYVIDFLILDKEILMLELNPFYKYAGAGLFSWRDDRQRLLNGPFELRVCESATQTSVSAADPYSHISTHWLRFLHPELDRHASKPQTAAAPSSSSPSLLFFFALLVAALACLFRWRHLFSL